MKKIIILVFLLSFGMFNLFAKEKISPDGYDIVKKSFNMWKGKDTSILNITMDITRPDRTENLSLKFWSKGEDQSILKFVLPAKYKGQSILLQRDSMWMYSPKSRKSIKISNSMKSNQWLGSDMSYNDISLSIEYLKQYSYHLKRGKKSNQSVYIIEAIPFESEITLSAKEIYYIRVSDNALLVKEVFNKDGVMIKRFDAVEISYYKNNKRKPIMKHMRVTNLEKEGYFTDFKINEYEFNSEIREDIFSLANLERP